MEKQPTKRKRHTKRRSKRAQKKLAANLLPEPIDVQVEAHPNAESSAEPKEDVLLSSLSGMFRRKQDDRSHSSQSESQNHSGTESKTPGETLTPEQQAQLNAIPDVIGEESVSAEGVDSGLAEPSDPMLSMLQDVAFSEQDVTDTLTELFGWLADKFDSEHWKLTDRQQRMLGGPTTQIVNASWAKLRTKLPDILARWCESTPGGTAFLMAFGIVVVPKAMKQVRLSRAKRTVTVEGEKREEKPSAPPLKKSPAPAPSGIAVASGIIGGD
jgi:hypothetical protein